MNNELTERNFLYILRASREWKWEPCESVCLVEIVLVETMLPKGTLFMLNYHIFVTTIDFQKLNFSKLNCCRGSCSKEERAQGRKLFVEMRYSNTIYYERTLQIQLLLFVLVKSFNSMYILQKKYREHICSVTYYKLRKTINVSINGILMFDWLSRHSACCGHSLGRFIYILHCKCFPHKKCGESPCCNLPPVKCT